MLTPLSYFFGPRTQPVAATAPTNEHPLTQLIKDNVDLGKASQPLLGYLNKQLKHVGVPGNHLLCQEIDKRLNHKALPILGFSHAHPIRHSSPQTFSEKTYVQPNTATIEETQKALEALEGKLDTIELCWVNDDLVEFIAQKFPGLKTFKIENKYAEGIWESFTQKSYESIAKMKALKSLTLDAWDCMYGDAKAMTKLISQPHFIEQLEEFKSSNISCTDKVLAELAKYKQLKTLYLDAAFISEQGFMTLCQSQNLQKSLVHLTFYNIDSAVTDNSLANLKDFKSLKHLTIFQGDPGSSFEKWKVTDPAYIAFLGAHKDLITLDVSGPVINDTMAEKIGQMTQLEMLRLDKCSELSRDKGWKLLLSGKDKLAHLALQNADTLDTDNMALVSQLPLSFLSIDIGNSWTSSKWLQQLCASSPIQKNLQTLRLTGLKALKSCDYEPLQALEKLSSLRLMQCPGFNEDALKFLSQTSLAKTLDTLELVDTYIDDNCVDLLAQFPKLQNLLLKNCYALTKAGFASLLKHPSFQDKLVNFALANFAWSKDEWKAFANFKALKNVIIDCDDSAPDDKEGLYKLAREHGFYLKLITWNGGNWPITIELFELLSGQFTKIIGG